MTPRIVFLLVVGLLGTGGGMTNAADLAEQEARPTIKERLTNDTIKGTLMQKEGAYYTIKENDGTQHKIHVDKNTKADLVKLGDIVKAYVTDQGHTTTLERTN